jgi:hypothetical protein
MMEGLRDWDKEFTSMQESFDTTTAMGRFVMDIIQRIAQLESEQIGERVYIGMRQKASEGKGILGFNAPYGFDFEDGNLLLNGEESEVVREMYSMYLSGYTLRKICRDLEERDVRTKKGSDHWDPKTVQRILSNPIYCGYLRWDGIIYRSEVEGIINEDTYNRVQEKLHRGNPHFRIDIIDGPVLMGQT